MLNYEQDALDEAVAMAAALPPEDSLGIVGYGVACLRDKFGHLKSVAPFANGITDAGDLYYARKAIVGVGPTPPSAPTAVNGMHLGTGTATTTKAGAGATLQTYLSGSGTGVLGAFDSNFPSYDVLATTLGARAIYQTTWPGTGLAGAITEASIVTDQATNANSSAANTIARATFASQDKGATDTFSVTWNHKFLGVVP